MLVCVLLLDFLYLLNVFTSDFDTAVKAIRIFYKHKGEEVLDGQLLTHLYLFRQIRAHVYPLLLGSINLHRLKAIGGRVFERAVYPRGHARLKQTKYLLSLGRLVFAKEEIIDGEYLYFDFVLIVDAKSVEVRVTGLVAVENE